MYIFQKREVPQCYETFFRLFKSEGFGKPFGPVSQVGDKLGCGIKFTKDDDGETPQQVKVFFTHNRKEVDHIIN